MIVELPVLEDLCKDDVLEEAPAAPYPVHPFFILEQNSVACFFEPLFSVRKMGVIGLEAVRRAVDPGNPGRLFEPRELFRHMTRADSQLRLSLDRLFRQKSLESFLPLQSRAPQLLMLMDVESSVLEEAVAGPGYLRRQTGEWSLDPRRLAVQVSLSGEIDAAPVRRFVESQRDQGFLTSLRDVDNSQPHLEILLRLNPDMVKVEEGLVRGLAGSQEKQAAFLGVLRRAHSLGILVVAGGLESEEDALVALEFGADLVQGRYFSKCYKENKVFTLNRKARMQFLASRFKRRLAGKANRDLGLKSRCAQLSDSITAGLPDKPARQLEAEFHSLFGHFPALECLYLLNAEGVQVSEIFCSQSHIPERKRLLFHPSPKGTDHSLREFYYALLSTPSLRRYVTEPYLSMNSGNLCVTAASLLGDPSGDFHILCADLNVVKA